MEETKNFPELTILESHFARLLERGERESATGALRCGLASIAQMVASHPECALMADRLLAEQDDAITGHVASGNGVQVRLLLARVLVALQSGPPAHGLNATHHPMTAPAPRRDIPAFDVNIADGGIAFVAKPAPKPGKDQANG